VILLPDILASEKSEIREIAKKYAQELWTIPFDKGIVAYVKTNNKLFVHPARWRYCFKCGLILKTILGKDTKTKDETINHSCILEFEDVPLLVKTSWFQLRKFFLIKKQHNKILKEIGLSELPKPKIVVKQVKAETVKTDVSDAISEESN
jgi:hypothetical protein